MRYAYRSYLNLCSCLPNSMEESVFTNNRPMFSTLTRIQDRTLSHLTSVHLTIKLQNLRRERQRGTGTWIFDLPEMHDWLETSNSALWIFGIPGAGKTILSTLVVDEVLHRKRSNSIGTAYYYRRHDDKDSQKVTNLLGSLIPQLARQNSVVLDDVIASYAKDSLVGSLSGSLEDDDLVEHLVGISRYFTATFVMIDGLDECGPALNRDRKRLIDVVANLHRHEGCSIRTLIFSRDERDIRSDLEAGEFQSVSIAAKSADLRLYVSAWLPSLHIHSEDLMSEIVDTLVHEANGM